jgi:hypothetical protein
VLNGCVQRLYLEVRHAVRHLYVQQMGVGGATDAWFVASRGGLDRTPASAADLPGPCGGQKLHVQPKDGGDDEPLQLPKVGRSIGFT